MNLSNETLTENLIIAKNEETKATIKVLLHLVEFDTRKLYLELGYSSLFDYATRKLKYSEGSAQRRIVAARCIKDHPELIERLINGEVTLCSISVAALSIKQELTTVEEISGKSKREVEAIVARVNPKVTVKRERIKAVAVGAEAMPIFDSVPPPPDERYEISFSVSKETFREYEVVRDRLSNKLGASLSVERVFESLLEEFLSPRKRVIRRYRLIKRHVPKRIREEVAKRDGYQCTYIAPDGNRCCETRYLEVDHVRPFALGGLTEFSNLRLLCSGHNKLEAEKTIGR